MASSSRVRCSVRIDGVTPAVTYAFVPTEVIETSNFDAQFRPGQPLLRRPKHSGTIRLELRRGPVGVPLGYPNRR